MVTDQLSPQAEATAILQAVPRVCALYLSCNLDQVGRLGEPIEFRLRRLPVNLGGNPELKGSSNLELVAR
jgi:hypothetical protein